MTREEIIKELSEMRTDAWTDTRQMEALAEGIKAIKAIEGIKADITYWHDCSSQKIWGYDELIALIDKHIGGSDADEKN